MTECSVPNPDERGWEYAAALLPFVESRIVGMTNISNFARLSADGAHVRYVQMLSFVCSCKMPTRHKTIFRMERFWDVYK